MNILSVVILSNTIDAEIHQMNNQCISSLMESEEWNKIGGLEILLIESNKQNQFAYDKHVKILSPDEPFNFHRFLNIGVEQTQSDFVALCNNDIIFSKNWFSEIRKVNEKRKDFMCFSPIDRDYVTMSEELFSSNKDYYVGWDNKYHFAAWCFLVKRELFSIIGKFDESFNFYAADLDFLMTLRKYAIDNVLVTQSKVKHISQVVTKKLDSKSSPKITNKENFPIPEKYLKMGMKWLWDDRRFYEAFFILNAKWGDEKIIRRINRLLDKFPFLRKRFFTKLMYSKTSNSILSKLQCIFNKTSLYCLILFDLCCFSLCGL